MLRIKTLLYVLSKVTARTACFTYTREPTSHLVTGNCSRWRSKR